MLATPHSSLREFSMVVSSRADDDKLNVWIRKKVVCCAVMLCTRIVDSTVLASLNAGRIDRCFSALQESIHLEIGIREDEGQVEALGRKTVAHESDFDWRHVV